MRSLFHYLCFDEAISIIIIELWYSNDRLFLGFILRLEADEESLNGIAHTHYETQAMQFALVLGKKKRRFLFHHHHAICTRVIKKIFILPSARLTKYLFREIHPLEQQPNRYSMLASTASAPRVTRCSLGLYWSRDLCTAGWLAGWGMLSYLGQIVRGSEIWWFMTSAHSLSTSLRSIQRLGLWVNL